MFKLLVFLFTLSILTGSPEGIALPLSVEQKIEEAISKADRGAQVGIFVLAPDGQTCYQRSGEKRFVPGSVSKLFVAAAALDLMGADYRFETRLVTKAPLRKNTLFGNCYLVASGDPSFDFLGLERLIKSLKAKGINRIRGDFCLDLTLFDEVIQGPGWMWDEEPSFWCSPLGALNVEHNCISFELSPDVQGSSPCSFHLYPPVEGVEISNQCNIKNKEQPLKVRRLPGDHFEISGFMRPASKKVLLRVPFSASHLFAQAILKKLFKELHIQITGEIKVKAAPRYSTQLAVHRSSHLADIIKVMLKESDNLYADALFKKIGHVRYRAQGTWQTGREALCEFLEKRVGLDPTDMVILDGSGMSRYNLVSPKQMALFLQWVDQKFPFGAEIKKGLPIAGVDGTLKRRMKKTSLEAQILAKTGTMTGVSSLCGFLKEDFIFAIFVNGYVTQGRLIKKEIEDEICHAIAN